MIPLHASAPVEKLVVEPPAPLSLAYWFGRDKHLENYLELEKEKSRLLEKYIGFACETRAAR